MEMGILKYLISQNTDGLHRLSGIPAEKISELHGNGLQISDTYSQFCG
jgi:NAD-dependent SIR2 family protein deacetylase